ncbi:hypothetical protein BDZ94DRAFT_1154032 [Collybia nuda]|uniref:RING-type domain-containing protein n=1 Tax=Collybia nuda TaxID=64659 RepID=A0A9P5YFD3_9AGAR|nr:hypothetical protein BDZ94DRAFT_1154032 [Collybia nuda]
MGYVARVLEIIPDVEPDHLLALVTKLAPSLQDGVVEHVLHELFEDPAYPKVDKKGKGKRRQTDEDIREEETSLQGGSPAKRHKVDYSDKTREFRGGIHYTDLALEQLQTDNPYIPKPYLRQLMASFNGLYAPTHLFLVDQEKQRKENKSAARLPYIHKVHPFRQSSKGKTWKFEDAEFEKEVNWLQDEAERRDRQAAEELNDEETGIECACCFSRVPFDKMVQCPETHLFCIQCMNSYAGTLLGGHDPNIICIHQSGCKAAIPPSELRRFLSTKMMQLWERLKQRKEVEAAGLEGLEECPFCEWGCLIENEDEKLFRCGNNETCGVVSCRGCKKLDHLPKSCKEVEEEKALDGRHVIEEAMTRALMRNCPKCQKPFVKEHGCNKMTCPNCHTLSCYICRQVITGYDHFNQVPIPTTSANAAKCLLWDAVEQRHAEEVATAAQRALEEYKQKNPDVDEKELHVDLPPAPAAPPQPPHVMNMGMGHYGIMDQNRNQARAAHAHALQGQLTQLQHQRDMCQLQIHGFEAQTQLMRATVARNVDPRFAQIFLQQQVDMAEVVEQERRRLLEIQARMNEVQARVDRARVNPAAQPFPQQPMHHPLNINVNINYGRQAALLAPRWRVGRR